VVTLDENYLFNITQVVKNNSKKPISISSYGRVSRVLEEIKKPNFILHEGPLGVFNGVLNDVSYKKLSEEKQFNFKSAGSEASDWLGITDKYWLAAIITDPSLSYDAKFVYKKIDQNSLVNAEFLSDEFGIAVGQEIKFKATTEVDMKCQFDNNGQLKACKIDD
jgi:YidC/Oxa1 family membrane protein insertase